VSGFNLGPLDMPGKTSSHTGEVTVLTNPVRHGISIFNLLWSRRLPTKECPPALHATAVAHPGVSTDDHRLAASLRTPRTRRGWTAATVAAVVAALVGAPAAAHADDFMPSEPASQGPQRVFGFGTAFGGGVAAATAVSGGGSSASFVGPALLLPTLEFQGFFPGEYSLDVTLPVTNMILVSSAMKGFLFSTDVFFNANIGKGTERFVVGPGLGFSVLALDGGSATTFRLPAQIGLEILTKKRGFGFKLLARPWLEVASGSRATAVGGGVLGALVFSGYSTRGL
jgi:hypothetical protein